jgi:signal transduction histidine kinase
MVSFDLAAGVTARLASTARLDEVIDIVLHEILDLGFASMWIARLDEPSGMLTTLKSTIGGADITDQIPQISMLDMRQPIGHGFRERRMVNIKHPERVQILDHDDDTVPPDRMALPRAVYNGLRGHPFACGPLFGSHGQPVGALGVASYRGQEQIPDELLSQGVMRAFIDHLGIAMERAFHIEQLHASLVKAQAAIASDARIKAVGELASAVAHDLNNLAGVALLAAGVGMRSSADALDMLPRIERANRAIGDVVARLQRLTRAPSGEIATATATANLAQIIEDILIMVRPVLHERSIAVDAELSAVSAVRCDPVLIHQVVLNLVLNAQDALDAVPAERRRIRIQLREADGAVRAIVSDTGPGISAEVLARLFRPFTTTKRDAHLGIGLAAAQASLKDFDAWIEGRNAPSGGAVFEVTWVAAPPGAPEAKAPHPTRPVAPAAERHARILAIDDDPDVVYIIQAYLDPLGHAVATATTSDEALAMAAEQAFDVVLCDIGMPKRNGIDVCRALRESGYRGKLVLMTGWENYQLSDDQRAVACDTLLKKPFLGADLIGALDALLATS